MTSSNTPPPAVLDYAPASPQRRVAKRLVSIAFILACGVLGVAIARSVAARDFTAIGYLSVASAQTAIPENVSAAQKAHAAAIRASVPALIPALKAAGVTIIPAQLQGKRLVVDPVPQSRLIAIAFTDFNPTMPAIIVNTLITSYAKSAGPPVTVVAPAASLNSSRNDPLYLLTAFFIAAAAGSLLIVIRRWLRS